MTSEVVVPAVVVGEVLDALAAPAAVPNRDGERAGPACGTCSRGS
ncbi:hypothetical protein [Streptomyces parvus]